MLPFGRAADASTRVGNFEMFQDVLKEGNLYR